jgi:hypothetical protein
MLATSPQIRTGYGFVKPIPWHAWGPMEARMRMPDTISKTVLFLGQLSRGEFVPYGTGFITATFEITTPDEAWQTVVTARHVIERMGDLPHVYARLNGRDGTAQIIQLDRADWFFHPDTRIDAAVCPTRIPKDQFDIIHFPLSKMRHPQAGGELLDFVLGPETIQVHDIGIGDEVYLSGMFVGRIGDTANIPILRMGTIAAMSGEAIRTEYGYHEAFLIEVRSIDGLSGSPVCVHLPPERTVPYGIARIKKAAPNTAYLLMGMVLGYNEVYNPLDALEFVKTDRRKKKVRQMAPPLNTGIAVVLPIWKIIEAIDQPNIQTKREEALKRSNKDHGRGFVATAAAPLGFVEVGQDESNSDHREDFTRLLGAAAKSKQSNGRTSRDGSRGSSGGKKIR